MPISLNTPGYVYLWWKTGVQRPCPFNEYLEHKMPFGAYCSGNGECKSGGVLAGTSGCQIRKPGFKCGVAYCSRRRDVYSNPGQLVSKMVGGECNRLDMGFSSAAWVSHFLMHMAVVSLATGLSYYAEGSHSLALGSPLLTYLHAQQTQASFMYLSYKTENR